MTRNELIESCLPLVRHLAGKLLAKRPCIAAIGTLDDIVSEGTIGLIRAAEAFDPARGVKFCSFAGRCVINSILKAADKESRRVARVVPLAGDVLAPERADVDREQLASALARLRPRERLALVRHYGEGEPLAAIGGDLGVTRERVRQIVRRAVGRAQGR